MDLEQALAKIGELETAQEPLVAERDRLKTHNERLLKSVAKANERAETAENERDDVRGKLPAEGTVTLPKADAELLDNYKSLGKLDELSGRLEQGQAAQKAAHRANNRDALREAGYDPDDFFLERFDGVNVSTRTADDKSKTKITTVKVGDAEKPLLEWGKENSLESTLARYRSDSRPGSVVVLPQYQGDGKGGTADPTQATRDNAFGI